MARPRAQLAQIDEKQASAPRVLKVLLCSEELISGWRDVAAHGAGWQIAPALPGLKRTVPLKAPMAHPRWLR